MRGSLTLITITLLIFVLSPTGCGPLDNPDDSGIGKDSGLNIESPPPCNAIVGCGDHGTCVEAVCECEPGFYGVYCEKEEQPLCEGEHCEGPGGSVTDLCDVVDCGDQGNCIRGQCYCNDGWSGNNCENEETAPCDDVECGDHGNCVDGQCYCNDGWAGDNCEDKEKIVFVTISTHDARLGGLDGADSICQTEAVAAGLNGTFKAWLSDSTNCPAITFTQSAAPYKLVDGTTVALDWTDLIDGELMSGISLTAEGEEVLVSSSVYTNTDINGNIYNSDDQSDMCNQWTTNISQSRPAVGRTTANTGAWTSAWTGNCWDTDYNNYRLYCFEQ